MAVHSIRLRGPWRLIPLARAVVHPGGGWRWETADLPAAGTLSMPADWSDLVGGDFQGLVRHERRFHRPTGLEDRCRVGLVIENVQAQAAVALNGQFLGFVRGAGASTDRDPATAWQLSALERLLGPAADSLRPRPSAVPLACPAAFDISARLQAHNDLVIDVLHVAGAVTGPDSSPSAPGGLLGLVRLEIESPP